MADERHQSQRDGQTPAEHGVDAVRREPGFAKPSLKLGNLPYVPSLYIIGF
jgi:hypothetical protein